jgi:hypothetical protein
MALGCQGEMSVANLELREKYELEMETWELPANI